MSTMGDIHMFNQSTTNATMGPYLDDGIQEIEVEPLSSVAKVLCVLIYTCLSALAIGGNSIVVFIVIYFRRMRSPTNLLILNLALADLMISIFCLPLSYWSMLIIPDQRWILGELLCRILPFLQGTAVFLSSWTLVAISFDRFVAIMFLLRPALRVTKSKALGLICLTWCFSVVMALPFALVATITINAYGAPTCTEDNWKWLEEKTGITNQGYSTCVFVLQYCVPLGVLIVTYAGIGVRVWNSRLPGSDQRDGENRRIVNDRRESVRKMVPMMILVSFLYGICWLPQNVLINILLPIKPEIGSYRYILYVWWATNTIAMSHSVVNPLIYYLRNQKFREGFRFALRWVPMVRFEGLESLTERSHHRSQAVRIVNMVAYLPVTVNHVPIDEADDGEANHDS